MAYSVLTQPWLPVRLADGSTARIAPWQVADSAVVDISHPRPDLTGAARELMIGLLQALYPPEEAEDRDDRILAPPSVDELRAAFEARADLFELINGPSRFLQEHGGLRTDDVRPIDNLLLNGPGEQTRKLLKDFFVRRDLTTRACPDCVVLMLAAKQFYASGTGPGFRVSPRGGGPLTTLIEFTDEAGNPASLWSSLYANVLPLTAIEGGGLTDANAARVLPWLAPLRVSKASKADVPTTIDHAHPLQVLFPLPARAEMIWERSDDLCSCDVCGSQTALYATGWKTAQYGVQYLGLEHPLTPYRVSKDGEKFSMKPKTGGISYSDWAAITLGAEGKVAPSRNIQEIRNSLPIFTGMIPRVRAYGYHLENASALAWHEAVVPFVEVPEDLRADFAIEVGRLVEAAQEIGSTLVSHIKTALYDRPTDQRGDFGHVQREFIAGTSAAFYDILPGVLQGLRDGDVEQIKRGWLSALQHEALRLFDRHAAVQVVDERNLERLVRSHRKFASLIRGNWALKILALPALQKKAA